MKISHHMRKEDSGLVVTTLEIAEEEQRQGHGVRVCEPSNGVTAMFDTFDGPPDIHCIHSQLSPHTYHDKVPKVMWMHGEPLGSVGNGVSMRAIVDLAPSCEAFICMRKEEQPVWDSIKRTFVVTKGIDLTRFKPLDHAPEKLQGDPAILYYENWRGQRNPLMICVAMEQIHREFPEARLHLYNCPGGKMHDTFLKLIHHNRWYTFIGSLKGKERDVVTLLNRADVVVSGLHPLYARGIEAFGCGKAFIGPGYKEHEYEYQCDLEPISIASAIRKVWLGPFDAGKGREFAKLHFRKWAETHHDVANTIKESVEIYGRYT